ncbi:hypothetical protein NEOLEDRAFT_1156416 [Neolentinus lepideus HHB14362 ss-1]|uniref:RING-type domain-containing protein n=1 Tax=Neolentinus lepideus HHB14362 ss-1 TaxID=1314782 RepID=A0A165SJ24_9AGAM|nr:hypothetical protein NEOLEDRAFT_1156416 [Neolentinus lepideus HHB14362 ss-1]
MTGTAGAGCAYTSPRLAPQPPPFRFPFSVSHRSPPKSPSSASLRSTYTVSSQATSYTESQNPHPFAAMVPAPLPVVSSHDTTEEEEECPVCLEPLSFSFRLPGEKPHIVPECGHALHEACFTAVYGPPPSQKGVVVRKSNLGVCGVCRRPMKVGDGDGGKSNSMLFPCPLLRFVDNLGTELAALTGMGDRNTPSLYPGRDTPASVRSLNGRVPQTAKPFDPMEDDAIEHAVSVRSGGSNEHSHYVVAPSILVRSEHPTLARTTDDNQPLTCIVVVELPGKRSSPQPGPVMTDTYRNHARQDTVHSSYSSPRPEPRSIRSPPTSNAHPNHNPFDASENSAPRNNLISSTSTYDTHHSGNSDRDESGDWNPEPSTSMSGSLSKPSLSSQFQDEDNPFAAITEDLRNRIIDWKGHPLSRLGPLQMYDLLSVRRDSLVREFYVYLFKEAIICVIEEKKKSLGRFLQNAGVGDGANATGPQAASAKGVLRLKGRIYIQHIKQVTDTSSAGEMSLTIDMEDERLDSFILIFRDRSSLETWKSHIQNLVTMFQQQSQAPRQSQPEQGLAPDLEEFGGSAKAARMLSGSTTATTVSSVDSLLAGSASRSTMSSSTSHGSRGPAAGALQHKLSTLEEADDEASRYDPHSNLVTPHLSSGPSNSLTPLPHPPLDLILVISLPSANAVPATAQLKIRVIKNTLDFVIGSLGMKDRLSLVTFEVGIGGRIRKTPFLCLGRAQSRARLTNFVDEIGLRRSEESEFEDEFLVRSNKDEKTDVVTAVNHGLDVVLQRKARNPISGMLLVSDSSESTRRAQMDLVLARAEAANAPIHSFGYGRSHDPASLWLISNHTSGTYVYVKDWYDLRDCVAGCIGGMMSIGLLNMKLHMKILDGHRFRIRKVSGGPTAILSSDGRDVDVEVGELRYGEKKEMLIELELDNTDVSAKQSSHGHNRSMNATDAFNARMGLESLTIDDTPNLVDGMMDRMIDEVPVFEVDGSFFDPQATKHVSRLAHPVLLTVTLLPPTGSRPRTPAGGSDPVIVRRRMELLASDMITRALVLVSRKNFPQAMKIVSETKRILHTVLQNVTQSLPPPTSSGSSLRNRKELLTLATVRTIQAILQDMEFLHEALEDNVELFAHDQRNFGAQQAMILRDQKSWTGRSATERLFWTSDNSVELVSRSTDWVARD